MPKSITSKALIVTALLIAPNTAYAASTLYCDVKDDTISFALKGISQQVHVAVEKYELQLLRDAVSFKADRPSDSSHYMGLIFEGQDRLTLKSQFRDPDISFEASMANAGKDEDDAINWQGGYKLTFANRPDQPPLRGAISCSDGY
ncbi:MAG: hypothetical protein N4A65_08740 [Cohaesibacter sp.]|jgi:hypothetical protein|nr:hypothetical protein [Cohaesibacter sp.]